MASYCPHELSSIGWDNSILYAGVEFDPWTLHLFTLWVDFQATRLSDKKKTLLFQRHKIKYELFFYFHH
jgi:hypothetical protein